MTPKYGKSSNLLKCSFVACTEVVFHELEPGFQSIRQLKDNSVKGSTTYENDDDPGVELSVVEPEEHPLALGSEQDNTSDQDTETPDSPTRETPVVNSDTDDENSPEDDSSALDSTTEPIVAEQPRSRSGRTLSKPSHFDFQVDGRCDTELRAQVTTLEKTEETTTKGTQNSGGSTISGGLTESGGIKQCPGVKEELRAYRERIQIEDIQAKCSAKRHDAYSCGVLCSGGCLDTIGACRASFIPIYGSEKVPLLRSMFESLTSSPCHGDAFTLDYKSLPKVSLLLTSFPCEQYSTLGDQSGMYGPGTGELFVKQSAIILALMPHAFMAEMTANIVKLHDGVAVKELKENLSSVFHLHDNVLSVWHYGDPTARARYFLIGFNKETMKEGSTFEWPAKIYNQTKYPTARDIAVPDKAVPKNYWLQGTPKEMYAQWDSVPGKIHQMGNFGHGCGHSSNPNALMGFDGLMPTQLRTNGNGRRVSLNYKQGDPITMTRLTTPVETIRCASLPSSYQKWISDFNRKDTFLQQAVNAGVPIGTAHALCTSIFTKLQECNIPLDFTSKTSTPTPMPVMHVVGERDHEISNLEMHEQAVLGVSTITYKKAMESNDADKWEKSIQKELHSVIVEQEAVEWVFRKDIPTGSRVLPAHYVLKVKPATALTPEPIWKARICVNGNLQTEKDYDEIFSPVVRWTTLRILLCIAAKYKLKTWQFDIKTAFVTAKIKGPSVFVKIPKGVESFLPEGHTAENSVWKLKKALYGLKQSPRIFNESLHDELTKLGLQQSKVDSCLYLLKINRNEKSKNPELASLIKGGEEAYMYCTIYVDDCVLFATHQSLIDWTLSKVQNIYKIENFGKLKHLLGVQIFHEEDGSIIINQEDYILRVLEQYKMQDCNPTNLPASPEIRLTKEMEAKTTEEIEFMKDKNYRGLVGSLLYCNLTRPDICYQLKEISKFLDRPGPKHYAYCKYLLRYLKGTRQLGLKFTGASGEIKLKGYADADYAGDLDSRRSTSGMIFLLHGSPIVWKSQTQKCVALSTAEAEYISLSAAVQEATYLRYLLQEFDLQSDEPTEIFEDNAACTKLAKNPVAHGKSKHIEVKHHHIREKVADGTICITQVPTDQMMADMMTKTLTKQPFVRIKNKILLLNRT